MVGLVKTAVALVKRDQQLEEQIIEKRDLSTDKSECIREMLRYNHWTVQQFSDLTGLSLSSITNLTRPRYDKDGNLATGLDFAYPFAHLDGDGPKFIVRNEKSEKYL